jgi:hypothetical protein
MLIEFSVRNFKSFKDEVTLSMVTTPIKEHRESHTFVENKISLLKSAVIYGANASGKSNLFLALRFMKWFVRNSSKNTQADESISYTPFLLNTETEKEPSMFEVVFFYEGSQYRYGFAIDAKKIHAEWLFYTPHKKEIEVFVREFQDISLSYRFKKEKKLIDDKLVRENALFISRAAQDNSEIATKVLRWFSDVNIMRGDQEDGYDHVTRKIAQLAKGKELVLNLLKKADIGIEDLKITQTDIPFDNLPHFFQEQIDLHGGEKNITSFDIQAFHKKYDSNNKVVGAVSLDLDRAESAGTQKFFNLLGPIIDTITQGKTLFIDEFDSGLHPRLIEELCSLFNSKEKNPHHAQLIFISHNTTIMSKGLLRRDQIWFVEKDRYGASNFYSLARYKKPDKARNDASYEKNYLKGRYGAVPVLRSFEII